MTLKKQCDDHGCKELLCGCPISKLESSSDFHEILRAKDKWINSLLRRIDVATELVKSISSDNDRLLKIFTEESDDT